MINNFCAVIENKQNKFEHYKKEISRLPSGLDDLSGVHLRAEVKVSEVSEVEGCRRYELTPHISLRLPQTASAGNTDSQLPFAHLTTI